MKQMLNRDDMVQSTKTLRKAMGWKTHRRGFVAHQPRNCKHRVSVRIIGQKTAHSYAGGFWKKIA